MNDQLYELTVEKNHLCIIIKALSNYICSQYDGLDAEVVDIPKTMENIKIASDMQLVLKHHLGGVQHSPKQTAETTGLVWIKGVLAEQVPPESKPTLLSLLFVWVHVVHLQDGVLILIAYLMQS